MNLSHSKSTGNVLTLQKFYQQKCQTSSNVLRKSHSTSNCVIVSKRGFKPSDRYDPHKKEFLTNLTQKMWRLSLVRGVQNATILSPLVGTFYLTQATRDLQRHDLITYTFIFYCHIRT
ncbi:hypothetical protein C0J52_04967 [Blattella germanica]|nr:hypothetical protein C0J52_04967 [Blattella germanica]